MGRKRMKVALALGGGGVRGLAHIGVIRALHEIGVHIDIIAGTSMGAMIGAQYALNPDINAIERRMLAMLDRKEVSAIEKLISGYSPSDEKKLIIESLYSFVKQMVLVNVRAIKRWVFSGKEISWMFEHLEIDTDFKKLKIPFCCATVDLRTGQEVIISKGSLKEAVLASVSLPGVFPPVKSGKYLLVDGGIIGSVPVEAARAMGADIVIAVGVEAQVDYNKKLGNGLDIMFQADAIRAWHLSDMKIKGADLIIYPKVGNISWASFSKANECIKAGEEATRKMKGQILEVIRKKGKKKFWRGFFSLSRIDD
ncbi:MAG: patatin-like phospholipase family protein [Candidatus Omnitrophica bacterium]|nr:patatin-like phospholipase family protein [Candidatus Omnitrophota bacterium]